MGPTRAAGIFSPLIQPPERRHSWGFWPSVSFLLSRWIPRRGLCTPPPEGAPRCFSRLTPARVPRRSWVIRGSGSLPLALWTLVPMVPSMPQSIIVGDGGTGSDHLATIDKATGAATVIGPLGDCSTPPCTIEGIEAFAFDKSGTLWGAHIARGAAGPRLGFIRLTPQPAPPPSWCRFLTCPETRRLAVSSASSSLATGPPMPERQPLSFRQPMGACSSPSTLQPASLVPSGQWVQREEVVQAPWRSGVVALR